jgi:hypothetical protein
MQKRDWHVSALHRNPIFCFQDPNLESHGFPWIYEGLKLAVHVGGRQQVKWCACPPLLLLNVCDACFLGVLSVCRFLWATTGIFSGMAHTYL